MKQQLKELLSHLEMSKPKMIEALFELCAINSGTENHLGLNELRTRLASYFTPIADKIESLAHPSFQSMDMQGNLHLQKVADSLFVQKRPHLKNRILLCGHMDTVYPKESPFQQLTYLDDNCLNGPGVADMKGGLIVMLHALDAFEKTSYAQNIGWDLFINADEEIGSPASSLFLEQISKQYQAALVYEPSMTAEGLLARNRRGSAKFTLIAKGKAAHVGRAFNEGRNAITHLAKALIAIEKLNFNDKGITFNVGKIAGGEALNVVPDKAIAKLDVRISETDDEAYVFQKLGQIINELNQEEGYSLELEGKFGRPVKKINPATEKLFLRIQKIGLELGLNIDWQDSGGCCDGNNLSKYGLPVIDTLGVRGGKIHSFDEFILLDSLTERAALSALLLIDLANHGLEELRHDALSESAKSRS
ncbi:MAG: hydrolase [Proteobacteria bacterium]|nr:hydrolase [Pseudomonadota bacterium]